MKNMEHTELVIMRDLLVTEVNYLQDELAFMRQERAHHWEYAEKGTEQGAYHFKWLNHLNAEVRRVRRRIRRIETAIRTVKAAIRSTQQSYSWAADELPPTDMLYRLCGQCGEGYYMTHDIWKDVVECDHCCHIIDRFINA